MSVKIECHACGTKSGWAEQAVKVPEIELGGRPDIGFLLVPGNLSHVHRLQFDFRQPQRTAKSSVTTNTF